MDRGLSVEQRSRVHYRHELRTLTYVTLDQANGGIVRNLTHNGMGVQAVAAVRPRQQLRVRFELRYPRVRVETRGEVVWSTLSGQCGIRFLDLSPRLTRQINEWIFGNLLEGASLHPERTRSIFGEPAAEEDGLMLSAGSRKVIELPIQPELSIKPFPVLPAVSPADEIEQDWLSQPLSGRSLAWTINSLVVTAALLLFAVVFLSITGERPPWPLSMACGAGIAVAFLYWGFFRMFGGSSPGARLARLADPDLQAEDGADRFR